MVITQNNCKHKNLFGNEQCRAVDSINIVRNSSLWKHTKYMYIRNATRVLSFIIIWRVCWPIEPKFSQVCYSVNMLGCTKWNKMVFNKNHLLSVPWKKESNLVLVFKWAIFHGNSCLKTWTYLAISGTLLRQHVMGTLISWRPQNKILNT